MPICYQCFECGTGVDSKNDGKTTWTYLTAYDLCDECERKKKEKEYYDYYDD